MTRPRMKTKNQKPKPKTKRGDARSHRPTELEAPAHRAASGWSLERRGRHAEVLRRDRDRRVARPGHARRASRRERRQVRRRVPMSV
eukprot:31195-Pelagococcus_subviridis.AAC.2